MNNGLFLPVAIVAGVGWGLILGVLYFGGLWLTVRRLPTTRHTIQLSIISLILRLGFCLAAFSLLLGMLQPSPLPLLGCVAAFFWTRNRMVQRLGVKVG
ncbi:MAG: ATP synthase subunit I [Gloeobacterales cyanobacterium]